MDRINKFLKYLSDINLLSADALEEINNLCSIVPIKKNKNLQTIGQTCKTIYFVLKGTTRIYNYKESC